MAEISLGLRGVVRERAGGRCEYCLAPETIALVDHQIDHIIATKHGGETELSNLALCCTLCNKHKGSDIASIDPETGEIAALFHPRNDLWLDHFSYRGLEIVGLTDTGRVTVRLLQFNRVERIKERQLTVRS